MTIHCPVVYSIFSLHSVSIPFSVSCCTLFYWIRGDGDFFHDHPLKGVPRNSYQKNRWKDIIPFRMLNLWSLFICTYVLPSYSFITKLLTCISSFFLIQLFSVHWALKNISLVTLLCYITFFSMYIRRSLCWKQVFCNSIFVCISNSHIQFLRPQPFTRQLCIGNSSVSHSHGGLYGWGHGTVPSYRNVFYALQLLLWNFFKTAKPALVPQLQYLRLSWEMEMSTNNLRVEKEQEL